MAPEEDPAPWSSLPSDILEHALALLPIPDIFRMRAVCKRWNTLIHCSQFQQMSSTSSWGPFFSPRLGWKGQGLSSVLWSSYDLAHRKWIPLPELKFPEGGRSFGWNLMAADGGLLCFGASDGRGILVCNPMVNQWKEIACVCKASRAPVISHMVVDERSSSYKILFVGNAACKHPDMRSTTNLVDVYDSVSQTWKSAPTLSADTLLRSGAYSKGEFFILTRHFRTWVYTVVALNLAKLTWRDTTISIPADLKYPYIVSCSGGVYLVGGSSEATDRMPMASILIFMLDTRKSGRWIKVGEYLNAAFLRSTGAIYGCGASGSRIHVVTHAYDMWVAVFNCGTRVWEEPVKGSFFDMKDIFETKFRFSPNLRIAP